MKFWKRQATLQIGSKRFGMDDLYFKFTVPFEDSEKLGTATIEAYNLSPATRNSIKKGMPIILNAGYEGDIGAIFTGKVSQVSDKHSGTEVITTIAAAEALEEWLSKEVNKTYTAGSKASAIVKDLLNIFGLEVGTMELAVDKEYPRGKGCKGNYVTMAKLAKKLPVFPYVSNQRSMLYIENLTEFVRLLIDDEAAGIFCPQNNEYTNTSDMVNWIAHANGKGILMVRGFTWALKLLRFVSPAVDKAFGSLCYDFALSRYSRDYCVKTLEQSILETERT